MEYDEQLEQEVERYLITDDFSKLFSMLKSYVIGKSRKYVRKYQARGLRVYQDDFEGVLWDAALDLIHSGGFRKNTFRVVLNHRLEDRAKNVIRYYMTDKRKASTMAKQLDVDRDYPSAEDVETTVINRALIEQMEVEPSLTEDERTLFTLMKNNPTSSNQQLAEQMDYPYKEKIRRLKISLRKKGAAML